MEICVRALAFMGAESDPSREHVTLRRHERKGLLICVDDHDPSRQRHTSRGGQIEDRHITWSYPRKRCVEAITLRPEAREILFPCSDYLSWSGRGTAQAHPIGLLPHLAKALKRSNNPASFYIDVDGLGGYVGHLQSRNRLRPVRRILALVVVGKARRIRHGPLLLSLRNLPTQVSSAAANAWASESKTGIASFRRVSSNMCV